MRLKIKGEVTRNGQNQASDRNRP